MSVERVPLPMVHDPHDQNTNHPHDQYTLKAILAAQDQIDRGEMDLTAQAQPYSAPTGETIIGGRYLPHFLDE